MSEGALTFQELESTAAPPAVATPEVKTEETPAAAAPVAEETKPQFTEQDVAAYQSLVDMGITPTNAQEFKAAKQAMDSLPQLLKTNPDLLFDEIQKNDPELHDALLEKVSDRWFDQKGKRLYEQQQANPSGSRTEKSESAQDPRVSQIEREWNAFKANQQQAQVASQHAQNTENFNKALDGLVDKLPKEVPEDKREFIRLKAEKLLTSDPTARQRINQGVFTDVPKYFAEASRRVTADTKTAADKEHEARKGVESRGGREIIPGADNTNGSPAEPKAGEDPIWGNISSAEIKSAYK